MEPISSPSIAVAIVNPEDFPGFSASVTVGYWKSVMMIAIITPAAIPNRKIMDSLDCVVDYVLSTVDGIRSSNMVIRPADTRHLKNTSDC